jgi:hypothetical protein
VGQLRLRRHRNLLKEEGSFAQADGPFLRLKKNHWRGGTYQTLHQPQPDGSLEGVQAAPNAAS